MIERSDVDQLFIDWVRDEWELWEQEETGGKSTLSTGGLRKHMHDMLDCWLDECDAITRASRRTPLPRKATAAVVSFPVREPPA